ncbi:MAG: hypothetical protein ACUVV6_04305, partial [Thermoplasmatota archaeon]
MNRRSWLLVGLAIAAAAFVALIASPKAEAWQSGDSYSGSGDWTIDDPTIVAEESLTVTGNIEIKSSLTVYNSDIAIDQGSDGQYTLNVASGGKLLLYDSYLYSNDSYDYKFTVYGSLHINYSYIYDMWGDTSSWVGGIQLYSSGAKIENSGIYYGMTGGIYIYNCSADILSNDICYNGQRGSTSYAYGIYVISNGNTKTKIENNNIFNNYFTSGTSRYGYGIRSEYQTSQDSIKNNYIYNNGYLSTYSNYGYQVYLYYSSPTISDCYLANGQYQLYAEASKPSLMDNMNFRTYALTGPTYYMVYGLNSTLKFEDSTWTLDYAYRTVYGVYADGPNENSSSALEFTRCTFTFSVSGTYTRYMIYARDYTPVDIKDCSFYNTYGNPFYGVYSTYYSPINVSRSSFYSAYTSSSGTYLIYASSYCAVNVSSSSFNLPYVGSSGGTHIIIRADSYCPVEVKDSSFNLDAQYSSSYNPYYRCIEVSSSSPLNITNSKFNMTTQGSGYYPYYARYAMIRASSNCPVTILGGSSFGLIINNCGYYPYECSIIYTTGSSPLYVDNAYFYFSGKMDNYAYNNQMIYVSGASAAINNTIIKIMNTGFYYMYGVYVSSGNLYFSNSTFIAYNLTASSYSTYAYGYLIYCYNYGSQGKFYINDSIIDIDMDQLYYTYSIQSYYCSFYMQNSTFRMHKTYGYGGYGVYGYGNYNDPYSDFVLRNSTIDVNIEANPITTTPYTFAIYSYYTNHDIDNCELIINSSYGFYGLYGGYANGQRIRNLRVTVDHNFSTAPSGTTGYVFAYYGSGAKAAGKDICEYENVSVLYRTWYNTPSGALMFYHFGYYRLLVSNSTFVTKNMAGLQGSRVGYFYDNCDAYFNNSYFVFDYGVGNDTASPLQFSTTRMYHARSLNFANTTIYFNYTDPVNLAAVYIEGSCEAITFTGSNIYWNVNAPNSTVRVLEFVAGSSYGPPTLKYFNITESKLLWKSTREECSACLIKIPAGGAVSSFTFKDAQLDFTLTVDSTRPSYIVDMSGVKDVSLKDLPIKLNAPPGSRTMMVGIKLEKCSVELNNITISSNGEGVTYGVFCDLASRAYISHSTLDTLYIGVYSSFFSEPTLYNTTVSRCRYGVLAENSGNGTIKESRMSNVESGVTVLDESWFNIIDSSVRSTDTDISMDGASTVWCLNADFDINNVVWSDENSTLIVNWWLQLNVTWQNGRRIPNALVLMFNSFGQETLRTYTDPEGTVHWLTVIEYTQTKLNKTLYSPYKVNVTKSGFSGEQDITVDKSKDVTIVIVDDALPILRVVAPVEGQNQNHTTVTVAGTCSDIGSGIDLIRISYNGVDWDEMPATPTWYHVIDVPEGEWAVQVELFDIAGNKVTATINILIDLTAPFIEVTSPADNSLGNSISVDLVGRVEPGSQLTVNLRPAAVSE